MKRCLNFFRLPFAEKTLLVESLFLVTFISLALRIIPFRFLKKALAPRSATEVRQKPVDWKKINSIARSVSLVSRFVPFATCLPQALAAMFLIKARGQHSDLKIGVAKGEGKDFRAHAWLETNGRIIIGGFPTNWQYKVLASLFK
jgi:hypothetical protein